MRGRLTLTALTWRRLRREHAGARGLSIGAVHVAAFGWWVPTTRVHGARHAARMLWSLFAVRGDVALHGGFGRSQFGGFLGLL